MKKGINRWAFPASMLLETCFTLARSAGFDGIELCLEEEGEFSLLTTADQLAGIARVVESLGLEISSVATGLYWKYSPTASDPKVRARALEIARCQLQFASILGADTILYVPGAVNVQWDPESEVIEYETVYRRAQESLKELTDLSERSKVNIGIENVWNKFLLSPLEMRQFIDEARHPMVGSYFDVGNVLISGYPEHWIKILGNRIKKVHVKDFKTEIGNINGFTNLLQGNVNWPAVVTSLADVGYDGYLTAEIMPPYRFHAERMIHDISGALDRILAKP